MNRDKEEERGVEEGGRERETEEEGRERETTSEEREERETREEEEKRRGWRVAYQNVGGSIEATNLVLARGRQEKWA